MLITLLLLGPPAWGQVPQQTAVTSTDPAPSLEQERASLERLRENNLSLSRDIAGRLSGLQAQDVDLPMVEQARVEVEAARLQEEELQAQLAAARERIDSLQKSLFELQGQEQLLQNPARDDEDSAQRAQQLQALGRSLAQRRDELEQAQQQRDILQEHLRLVQQRLALLKQWQAQVDTLYRRQQELSRQQAQQALAEALQQQRQAHLARAVVLAQKLAKQRDGLSEARQQRLETEIRILEEKADLLQLQIRLAKLDNDLQDLAALAEAVAADSQALGAALVRLRSLR
ncbi:MAG: hypothetical protein R3310_08165, partial [Candidatus Competibacteraceae bacterium]|nr:hypothetical protein [Candidatus Competibacteraceae bacterium]